MCLVPILYVVELFDMQWTMSMCLVPVDLDHGRCVWYPVDLMADDWYPFLICVDRQWTVTIVSGAQFLMFGLL